MLRSLIIALCAAVLACSGNVRAVDPLRQSPTDRAIEARLAGNVAYAAPEDHAAVLWYFREGGRYDFEQWHEGARVVWERGYWWVFDGALMLDREEGAVLNARTLVWFEYQPYGRPLSLSLFGRSLSDPALRVTIAERLSYTLTPIDEYVAAAGAE